MTAQKKLKQLVRARMQKTGESYASARRQVIRQESPTPVDPATRWHFPGNVPATTALRVVLSHAGIRNPQTREPYSEAMLFGIAGGTGAGMFTFVYEKENFASFFIAGRHNWQDDLGYLQDACRRFGIEPVVRESGGAKAAEKHLREALAEGPCVAWVDAAHLPHRELPAQWSGGGYHVITIYRVDDEAGTAIIGDLGDHPVSIALSGLAEARARIKKQKNRLLSVRSTTASPSLKELVREGLRNCYEGRSSIGAKTMTNFTLESFRVWGVRMFGSKDKESWEQIFTRGGRLMTGLSSIYDYIENYGTGGGLCRPVFAEFLSEAGAAIKNPALQTLSEQYADLGRRWSQLANDALPDDVPLFKEAKQLFDRKFELTYSGDPDDREEMRQAWKRLGELKTQAKADFPLSESECVELRKRLQADILALYETEVSARDDINLAVASI